jgi:LPXTG-motif cell wall-anchored protein
LKNSSRRSSTTSVQEPENQHVGTDLLQSLLPDATELGKLVALDPGMIDWIKRHVDAEQAERHRDQRRKVSLLEEQVQREFRLDRLAMMLAFVVIAAGMGFSATFAFLHEEGWGSLYAGLTVVAAAGVFFRRRRRKVKSVPEDGKDEGP